MWPHHGTYGKWRWWGGSAASRQRACRWKKALGRSRDDHRAVDTWEKWARAATLHMGNSHPGSAASCAGHCCILPPSSIAQVLASEQCSPWRKASPKEKVISGQSHFQVKFSVSYASFILCRKISLEARECEECHAKTKNAPKRNIHVL